jgi:hypothetical protein
MCLGITEINEDAVAHIFGDEAAIAANGEEELELLRAAASAAAVGAGAVGGRAGGVAAPLSSGSEAIRLTRLVAAADSPLLPGMAGALRVKMRTSR